VIVIGVRSYKCPCKKVIPQEPECGDRGVEEDE
jgi:hypothetical protein